MAAAEGVHRIGRLGSWLVGWYAATEGAGGEFVCRNPLGGGGFAWCLFCGNLKKGGNFRAYSKGSSFLELGPSPSPPKSGKGVGNVRQNWNTKLPTHKEPDVKIYPPLYG